MSKHIKPKGSLINLTVISKFFLAKTTKCCAFTKGITCYFFYLAVIPNHYKSKLWNYLGISYKANKSFQSAQAVSSTGLG